MSEADPGDEELSLLQSQRVEDALEGFLMKKYKGELVSILTHPDPSLHYGLTINTLELVDFDMEVSDLLINTPLRTLPVLEHGLWRTLQRMYKGHINQDSMTPKKNVHVRFSNLPLCPELIRSAIPRSSDIGKFLSVSGTVIRTSAVKVLEGEREFVCSKCGHSFTVEADYEQYYTIPGPSNCPTGDCGSIKFTHVGKGTSTSVSGCFRDYQEIKIQEQVQKLGVGKIPRSMWVVLENDLVDSCKAGDDVTVVGVVRRRWKSVSSDVPCDLEVALSANHVQVNNEQRAGVAITEELVSWAPSLCSILSSCISVALCTLM